MASRIVRRLYFVQILIETYGIWVDSIILEGGFRQSRREGAGSPAESGYRLGGTPASKCG